MRAALSIVEQQGLDNLNTNAIAAVIQLVPSAIYRHFKNKEDLVNYLVNKIENGETIMVNEGTFSKAAIKRIMKNLALISNEEYQKRLIGMVWGNSVVNDSKEVLEKIYEKDIKLVSKSIIKSYKKLIQPDKQMVLLI